jgi:hypothetical protein
MEFTTNQERAREALEQFLGMTGAQAEAFTLGLDDVEAAAIADLRSVSPGRRPEARSEIQQLVAAATERRQADEGRAGPPIAAAAAERNGARELLRLHYSLTADGAAACEASLTPEQRRQLGELADRRRRALANFQNDPVSVAEVRAIGGDLVAANEKTGD